MGIGLALVGIMAWALQLLTCFLLVTSVARLSLLWLAFFGRWELKRRLPMHPRHQAYEYRVIALRTLGLGVVTSALVFGGPLWGLGCLVSVPISFEIWRYVGRDRMLRDWDVAAIGYFYALSGLVQAGYGLSTALFRLADALKSPFASAMAKALSEYDSGTPLDRCLERIERRSSGLTALVLRSLYCAYREGLSVGELLREWIPLLEGESARQAKLRSLRLSTLGQAAVASVIPWILLLVLAGTQPDLLREFFYSHHGTALSGAALVWEGLGTWSIWRCSRFR